MAKKKVSKAKPEGSKNINLLIENSIALQKVLANLAGNLDDLSKDVRKMLYLFNEASKSFVGGKKPSGAPEVRALQNKLDNLIEQNKVMANGIILLENYLRGKPAGIEEREETKLKKLPQFKF